jgi:hypothetical protein
MDAQKENTFSMQTAVITFDEKTPEEVKETMPGYISLIEQLIVKHNEIGTLDGAQSANRKGFKVAKVNSKELLITKVMTIVFSTKAFAIASNNSPLEEEMKAITASKLFYMRDSKTANTAEEIIKRATENLTDLIPYGITQTVLDNTNQVLDNYRLELAKPRASIANRKLLNDNIALLFKECDQIFYLLDTLVSSKKDEFPDFYKEYFINRTIIDYKGHKLALRGIVVDENGIPIKNVIVSVPSLNLETKTTEKGYYEFKSLPAGIINIKFNKVTFQEISENVGIVKGERIQLNISLNSSQSNAASA